MQNFDAHRNFAISTVLVPPSPPTSGTSLTLAAGDGAKFGAPCNVTIWPAGTIPSASTAEVARVTGIAGDVLTIARAQEGSAAQAVAAGYAIANTDTAKVYTDIETAINTISAIAQAGGSVSVNASGEIMLAAATGLAVALLFGQDPTSFNKLIRLGSGNPGGASGNAYLEFAAPSGFAGNFLQAFVAATDVFRVDASGNLTLAGGINMSQGLDAPGLTTAATTPSQTPLVVQEAANQTADAVEVWNYPNQDTIFAVDAEGAAVAPGYKSSLTGGGRISSGSGVPSKPNGQNPTAGDVWLRTDTPTTANQRYYVCSVGGGTPTWVGIV